MTDTTMHTVEQIRERFETTDGSNISAATLYNDVDDLLQHYDALNKAWEAEVNALAQDLSWHREEHKRLQSKLEEAEIDSKMIGEALATEQAKRRTAESRLNSASVERGNLAVMLRMLARRILRDKPDDRQADAAVKLLQKYGLQGSVLREAEPVVEKLRASPHEVVVTEDNIGLFLPLKPNIKVGDILYILE